MTAEQHANLYEQHEWKHPTQVAGIPWKNPVATASGTFQYAAVRWFYDVSQLGAVTTKGVSPVPWEGNPGIRTAEGPSSNINAVGLQNPGVDHYLEDDLPKLKAINATVIANVAGHCDDDYAEVVSKLDDSPADMLEINVSCPNVSAGGMSVGTDPVALSRLITRLRKLTDKKMIVKLTPNVTDITVPARAAVESGADALSLINTLLGMRINIRTGEPVITHVTGGVSGPAVLPVGLAAVWRVRAALPEIPIIGIGGIDSGETALEYLYAGANAVEVGALVLEDSIGGFPGYYCQQAGFACYHPPIELLTDENVRDCKEHGVKMNVWTVNDMAGLEQLHRWGCEGIITNFPGVASGWLRAQGE